MELRDKNGLTEEEFLAAYKQKNYPKPSLTADIAVFRKDDDGAYELLLIRRGGHPFLGKWALPGGFAEQGEDIDETAARELAEETGVANLALEEFGVYATPGRDPRGWTASAGFVAVAPKDQLAKAGDDAADARWFKVSERMVDCRYHELEAVCGDERLWVKFDLLTQRFSGKPRAMVRDAEGFAFDHSRIVADAWLRIQDGAW